MKKRFKLLNKLKSLFYDIILLYVYKMSGNESKSTSNYALNLLILGVAIILVILAYQSVLKSDSFVGKVPMVPIGSGPGPGPYGIPMGVHPTGQPMMYPYQYYQAKYPYYNDTVNQIGRPCDEQNGCGVFGACQNGVCSIRQPDSDTVFNVKL